jgi:hypothetical protein
MRCSGVHISTRLYSRELLCGEVQFSSVATPNTTATDKSCRLLAFLFATCTRGGAVQKVPDTINKKSKLRWDPPQPPQSCGASIIAYM